jgi:hypothetical protein
MSPAQRKSWASNLHMSACRAIAPGSGCALGSACSAIVKLPCFMLWCVTVLFRIVSPRGPSFLLDLRYYCDRKEELQSIVFPRDQILVDPIEPAGELPCVPNVGLQTPYVLGSESCCIPARQPIHTESKQTRELMVRNTTPCSRCCVRLVQAAEHGSPSIRKTKTSDNGTRR